jgi:hypothetical protein
MVKHLLSFLLLFTTCVAFGQVTTGNLTGTVKDSKGITLPGATVVATHVPSGSVYSTVTGASGQYTLPNLRVGGPYTVTVTFIGFNTRSVDDINISLGESSKLDFRLDDNTKLLNEVVVSGSKNAVISPENIGTSTSVNQRTIQDLPTVSRSFQDFARLTPQAIPLRGSSDNSPLGISFAGQSSKYNQFTVDGAKANDVFGLSSSGTNGGLASVNPIPLESIQSFQILLSPYDVTQGRFVGGGVNAVTKSGTNELHGSAYDYIQNQGFIGKSVTTGLKYADFSNKTYGASLGGPIIKNKLFFFANFEKTDDTNPIAYDPTQSGSGSKFDPTVLQGLRNYVDKLSGGAYDPGSFGAINKNITSTSAFARLDWNIDSKNKLTLRNSYVEGTNFVISRSPTSITFDNSAYSLANHTNSTVLELNSQVSDHSSNVFRASYNYINDVRNTQAFPSITINDGSLTYNLGSDLSSAANALAQKDFNIVDYFTIYKGKHTITFGTDDEFYQSRNIFLQDYYGAYTYKSVAQFESGALPSSYAVGYATAGGGSKAPAVMKVGQMAVYGQDVWAASDNFRLTYGLRIDVPVFFNKPDDNVAFNSSSLATANGVATNQVPKSSPLFSPRIGFNYDINGDGINQLRGGAGIFTGQVPFVWISNQYTNTGVASIKYTTNTPTQGAGSFNYNPNGAQLGAYIPSSFKSAPTEIDVTDPKFKFPQQLRANLAIDHKFPGGLVGTLEALYSKKINDILYDNLNVGPQTGDVTLGNTTRPYYGFARANSSYTDVLELTNTSKGYSYDFTAQLKKQFTDGWSAMGAYTLGHSYSVNDGTSSTAISNWRFAYNTNGLNNLDEANSNYDPGSRVIAYVNKTFAYVNKRISTTIGIVYSGQTGERFSYLYNENISGDDASNKTSANADLVYIPNSASQFSTLTRTVNGATQTVTPAQQFADLQAFIADNKSLQKYVGKVTPRNAFTLPWENHFDVKIAQNFYVYKQHKLTVGLDILNAGNLIDKNWGRAYTLSNQDYNLFNVTTQTANPTFTFDNTKLNTVDGHARAYSIDDYNARWRGQLDLRYSF